MIIEQLIYLRKVGTENLKFRTDLPDQVMDGWSVTLLLHCKIKFHPVNAGLCMAFKHSISFVTELTANFGCYQFRMMPDIVSKLAHSHLK